MAVAALVAAVTAEAVASAVADAQAAEAISVDADNIHYYIVEIKTTIQSALMADWERKGH